MVVYCILVVALVVRVVISGTACGVVGDTATVVITPDVVLVVDISAVVLCAVAESEVDAGVWCGVVVIVTALVVPVIVLEASLCGHKRKPWFRTDPSEDQEIDPWGSILSGPTPPLYARPLTTSLS